MANNWIPTRDLYGDIINPSALFAGAAGDPSNPTIKYFVTTTKEKISISSLGLSWKKDNQLIGIINEATGENKGFKRCIKLFQKGKGSNDLVWIITEYSLNSNTPGVDEDLKNEVVCRVRSIPINNPKAQAQHQKEAQAQQQQEEEDEADIDLQLKL
ncbi:uncharacterized protein LOC129894907 [Solanum dulcamara]|uniref:uncharacterized protein LOC129894907 n=1 Tax=Solanum dulcamara TaxID=45834 RepID=UPI0024862CA7|nr:uncharacterized protein LOC129894907 [Solanum dulcamara]